MSSDLSREDIRMRTDEDGPILDIDGFEVRLQVGCYDESNGFDSKADTIKSEVDSNGDFSWWIVYPEDDLSRYVEITPEVGEVGEDG